MVHLKELRCVGENEYVEIDGWSTALDMILGEFMKVMDG